jgi:type 1 fimbria pilin
MKHSMKSMAAAIAATLILSSAPAWSARVPDNIVSGTVSAVSGNQIVVDGKSYSINVQTPALRALQRVQVGQVVDLVFDAKPGSSSAQVISIHVREGNH